MQIDIDRDVCCTQRVCRAFSLNDIPVANLYFLQFIPLLYCFNLCRKAPEIVIERAF